MDIKYLFYQGRKLKMHLLRDDYYALDYEIGYFFSIEKRRLLLAASRHKLEFQDCDIIILDKAERAEIRKIDPYERFNKIQAFSMPGILMLACILNYFSAREMAIETARASVKMIAKMRKIFRQSEFLKEEKQGVAKLIVTLELIKKKFPDESFETMSKGLQEIIDSSHQRGIQVDKYIAGINKLMEDLPEYIQNVISGPSFSEEHQKLSREVGALERSLNGNDWPLLSETIMANTRMTMGLVQAGFDARLPEAVKLSITKPSAAAPQAGKPAVEQPADNPGPEPQLKEPPQQQADDKPG